MDAGPDVSDAVPDGPPAPVVIDPGVISASSMSSSEHEPHVAAANQHIGVGWIARESPNLFIGYRISLDEGENWGPIGALPLPANNNIAADPFLAADAKGTLYIAWGSEQKVNNMRTNLHVFVARSAPGETTFGAPVEVTDPTMMGVGVYDQPKIAVTPAGALIATYMQASADLMSFVIVSAFSTDGQSWVRTNVAGPDPVGSFRNRAVLCSAKNTGDRVFMQYIDDTVGMALRWSDDGGKTWPAQNLTKVQLPAETSRLATEVGCAADGNDVWVFYSQTTDMVGQTTMPKLDTLRLAHSGDRGATIDSRVNVHDKMAGKYFLMGNFVRDEAGGLDVTYYAGNTAGDVAGSYRRARSIDGMIFTPSTVVHEPLTFDTSRTTLTWMGDYVGLATTGGSLHMAYADTSGAAAHIAYYRTSL